MPPTLRARKPDTGSTSSETRANKRSTASSREGDARDSATDEDDVKPAAAPKKKRKKASARSTKVGNDLFSTLPLDLLYQICGDLDPGTLLSISQVSKPIHRTLASKSVVKLWAHVRRSANLPDLSEPLSEPRYAFLAQGSCCQICSSSRKPTEAELPLRVRACPKCFKANLKTEKEARKENPHLHSHTFACALSSPFSAAGNKRSDRMPLYWVPDLAPVSDHLDSLAPAPPIDCEINKGIETSDTQPSPTIFDFQHERLGYIKRVEKDAENVLAFQHRALEQLENDQQVLRNMRFDQLCVKVAEAGYPKEDSSHQPGHVVLALRLIHSSAHQADGLLPATEWARIGKDVLKDVAQHQASRLAAQRYNAMIQRKLALQPLYQQLRTAAPSGERSLWPTFANFVDLPSCTSLWEPADAVNDPSSWPTKTPSLLADVQVDLRRDKIACCDAGARVMHAAGVDLDAAVVAVIEQEPSAFVDPRRGNRVLAPLHEQLSSTQIEGVVDHAAAIIVCNACGIMGDCLSMLKHLRYSPSWHQPACGPSPIALVKQRLACIVGAGMSAARTTRADMVKLGRVFDVQISGGPLVTKQTWEQITLGTVREQRSSFGQASYLAESFASITLNKGDLKERQARKGERAG
ncbi:hypothetical protein JCM9279_003601 [Rhodotorula babjevae]